MAEALVGKKNRKWTWISQIKAEKCGGRLKIFRPAYAAQPAYAHPSHLGYSHLQALALPIVTCPCCMRFLVRDFIALVGHDKEGLPGWSGTQSLWDVTGVLTL